MGQRRLITLRIKAICIKLMLNCQRFKANYDEILKKSKKMISNTPVNLPKYKIKIAAYHTLYQVYFTRCPFLAVWKDYWMIFHQPLVSCTLIGYLLVLEADIVLGFTLQISLRLANIGALHRCRQHLFPPAMILVQWPIVKCPQRFHRSSFTFQFDYLHISSDSSVPIVHIMMRLLKTKATLNSECYTLFAGRYSIDAIPSVRTILPLTTFRKFLFIQLLYRCMAILVVVWSLPWYALVTTYGTNKICHFHYRFSSRNTFSQYNINTLSQLRCRIQLLLLELSKWRSSSNSNGGATLATISDI